MLFYTGLIFLVIAVSLDGFGVGITYGMRKIRVPFIALFIIMLCSGLIVLLSMTIGTIITAHLSPHFAKVLGGFILISLGVFSLFNVIRSELIHKEPEDVTNTSNKIIQSFKTILKTPDRADLDSSGVISINEALLLGSALALDAFGAGLGASVIGYSPLITTVLIALMSGLFLFCGIRIGLLLLKNKYLQKMTFIPPLLLIILGISNIF